MNSIKCFVKPDLVPVEAIQFTGENVGSVRGFVDSTNIQECLLDWRSETAKEEVLIWYFTHTKDYPDLAPENFEEAIARVIRKGWWIVKFKGDQSKVLDNDDFEDQYIKLTVEPW